MIGGVDSFDSIIADDDACRIVVLIMVMTRLLLPLVALFVGG